VDKRRRRLTELSAKRCLSSPLYPVEERGLRLDRLVHRFGAAAERITARAGTRLAGAVGKLDAMSPLRVLSRGYALASKDGRVLRSVNDFEDGESFELRLCDGTLPCRVDKGCE
jgi:exodeoxyribonuclease VII large subunit